MKIESVRLKGFTGIKRGLGLDEISVSFQGITGLVAFDGQNGSGKTTLLDNLHPFPQLASRDGAIYHHCFLRGSERELCFTYSGHSYRTLLKIDCQSEKQEGYIWKDGASEVNGKISEYSKYIRALFGSPELFFASVFCAQNSKKLSDMTTGKLKELFAEFLRLDRYQEWEQTAKQCAAIMAGKVSQVDTRIAALTEQMAGKEMTRSALAEIEATLTKEITERDRLQAALVSARAQADALKEAVAQNAALLARRADLQRTIDRMTIDLSGEKKAAEGEIEELKTKYRELTVAVEKCDTVLRDKMRIEGAKEEERAALAHMETLQADVERLTVEIQKHQESVHTLEIAYQKTCQELKNIDNDQALQTLETAIGEMSRAVADQKRTLSDLENDRGVNEMRGEIRNRREKMYALDLKDRSCRSTTCSFIVSALAASDGLSDIEAALAKREEQAAAQKKAIEEEIGRIDTALIVKVGEKRVRIEALTNTKKGTANRIIVIEKELQEARAYLSKSTRDTERTRRQISEDRTTRARLKDLSARAPEIKIAEARRADLEKQRADVARTGKQKREAWDTRENSVRAVIECEHRKLDGIVIDQQAEENLRSVSLEIGNIEKVRIPDIEHAITKMRDNMAKLQGDLARLVEAEKGIEAAREEKDRLSREVSEWTYLRTACSKTGLQALEIDGAAPLITGYANELLSMAFGPLFTVKFRTQDEEGREVLDIVTIGEDGEEILLDNLSGGQRIWILMALRLAMTLLSKEKSGRVFETAFFDELDGPLDPDNALSFIGMYQAFMKVGGFKSVLFISHKPSCRNMADNALAFEMGGSPVWR
jgi:DNA repair protein SbcC/Rad50